ncbi:putative uncharacterized protein [Pseudomonas sp. StFLB209]|nr:putative uncharacterized protein [Pseudomonas sp. StFLB209]
MPDTKWHVQRRADLTTMLRPSVSYGLQAVMNMNGVKLREGLVLAQIAQQMQQDSGVKTTGESDEQGRGLACVSQRAGERGAQLNIVHGKKPAGQA